MVEQVKAWRTIRNRRAHGKEDQENCPKISSAHVDWHYLKYRSNSNRSTNSASHPTEGHADNGNSHPVGRTNHNHTDNDDSGGREGDISASNEVRYMTGKRSDGCEGKAVYQRQPRPDAEPANIVEGVCCDIKHNLDRRGEYPRSR